MYYLNLQNNNLSFIPNRFYFQSNHFDYIMNNWMNRWGTIWTKSLATSCTFKTTIWVRSNLNLKRNNLKLRIYLGCCITTISIFKTSIWNIYLKLQPVVNVKQQMMHAKKQYELDQQSVLSRNNILNFISLTTDCASKSTVWTWATNKILFWTLSLKNRLFF